MIVALVGAPATGKSHLRRALGDALGLRTFSIDTARRQLRRAHRHRYAWGHLISTLKHAQGPCVVESNITPMNYRFLLEERGALVIQMVASEETRRARLEARGYPEDKIVRFLNPGLEAGVEPSLVFDTSDDPDCGPVLEFVRAALNGD